MNICIQCALEAFANGDEAVAIPFTESMEEHNARRHADLTPEKRSEFLRRATVRMSSLSANVATQLAHVLFGVAPKGWGFVLVVQHPNHGRSLVTNFNSQDDAREVLEELTRSMRAGQGDAYSVAPPEDA